MSILAIVAVLFGAAILLFVLNDYRIHHEEYDLRAVTWFSLAGTGAICSMASGLKVLL
jgi:hypothetical protein